MEAFVEKALLYDFYGELLTEHQREIYEDVVLNDYSISEVAAELGISRQGVYDNLSRAEALLRNMEEKTGFVRRDEKVRAAARGIEEAAVTLLDHSEPGIVALAQRILSAVRELEE